jgi:hypothetical protein
MADQLLFNRDTKVFIESNSLFFEIPVLSDFTFSQSHNTSEITLNEASDSAGTSRRARQVFNDSFAPAEWSFSTYMRPFLSTTGGTIGTAGRTDTLAQMHAVEEILWDAFVDQDGDRGGTTSDGTDMDVNFSESNKTTVGTFNLYFILDWSAAGTNDLVYKIENATVNEASIDFDIEGIAMISWSGFGGQLTEDLTFDYSGSGSDYSDSDVLVYEGVSGSNNYIRNKLTTLDLVATVPGSDTYSIVLTGGNITFSNNLTYLTPETIGSVNLPLGHVTGSRSVSGTFTAYLDNDTLSTTELFADIAETTATVTTNFAATFTIGGATAPKVEIALPTAHLEIPTFDPSDVFSVDVNFHGLPTTIDGTDEATIKYFGIAVV